MRFLKTLIGLPLRDKILRSTGHSGQNTLNKKIKKRNCKSPMK